MVRRVITNVSSMTLIRHTTKSRQADNHRAGGFEPGMFVSIIWHGAPAELKYRQADPFRKHKPERPEARPAPKDPDRLQDPRAVRRLSFLGAQDCPSSSPWSNAVPRSGLEVAKGAEAQMEDHREHGGDGDLKVQREVELSLESPREFLRKLYRLSACAPLSIHLKKRIRRGAFKGTLRAEQGQLRWSFAAEHLEKHRTAHAALSEQRPRIEFDGEGTLLPDGGLVGLRLGLSVERIPPPTERCQKALQRALALFRVPDRSQCGLKVWPAEFLRLLEARGSTAFPFQLLEALLDSFQTVQFKREGEQSLFGASLTELFSCENTPVFDLPQVIETAVYKMSWQTEHTVRFQREDEPSDPDAILNEEMLALIDFFWASSLVLCP